jgi:hypothetical protein
LVASVNDLQSESHAERVGGQGCASGATRSGSPSTFAGWESRPRSCSALPPSAHKTLDLLRPALTEVAVRVEEQLYRSSSETLLERIRSVPDQVGSLMLIGHNPGLQDLALVLASSGAELERFEAKFPTAALAHSRSHAGAAWARATPSSSPTSSPNSSTEQAPPSGRRRMGPCDRHHSDVCVATSTQIDRQVATQAEPR